MSSELNRTWKQAKYKIQLDPTVEEVKKLCTTCRKYAKSERVLFHYNGHGVPKPTANGEIWFFNRVIYSYIFLLGVFFVPLLKLILQELTFFLTFYAVELYTVYSFAYQRP